MKLNFLITTLQYIVALYIKQYDRYNRYKMTINKSFKKLKENNFELFKLSFKCEDGIIKIVWGTQSLRNIPHRLT